MCVCVCVCLRMHARVYVCVSKGGIELDVLFWIYPLLLLHPSLPQSPPAGVS